MAKQKKLADQTWRERLARSLERWPETGTDGVIHEPINIGRFVDDSGGVWVLRRRLNAADARRLAASADSVFLDSGLTPTDLAGHDWRSIWASIEKRGHFPNEEPEDQLSYEPYEFDSEGGLTMLMLQRRC